MSILLWITIEIMFLIFFLLFTNGHQEFNLKGLSELFFSLPVTTSRAEQIFSQLNIIRTKLRSILDTSTLQDLENCVESPSLQNFDVNSAIDVWWKQYDS